MCRDDDVSEEPLYFLREVVEDDGGDQSVLLQAVPVRCTDPLVCLPGRNKGHGIVGGGVRGRLLAFNRCVRSLGRLPRQPFLFRGRSHASDTMCHKVRNTFYFSR